MEQIKLTYTEAILYLALFGIVIGILLGLIPLILGIRKKKRQYGIFGFIASIIGGAISPILAAIVVAIFTWLILRKPTVKEPGDVVINENPVDVKIENSENR
jgi:MFS family permease